MLISFDCPHCQAPQRLDQQAGGQMVPCAKCGQSIQVPVVSGGSGGSTAIIVIAVVGACGVALVCVVAILIALLLPAVQAAREAARRTQCQNNIKQLGLAMLSYNDTHRTFPPAYIEDENGQPMHSWRTMILPFMEQNHLYNQYDFNKPWNDEANQFVVNHPVPAFRCPSSSSTGLTETQYFVVTGHGLLFDGQQARTAGFVADGLSNTIMIVEVEGMNTQWAEPKDITLKEFLARVESSDESIAEHPGVFNVVYVDAATMAIREDTIDIKVLEQMLTPNDGLPVGGGP